MPGEMPLDLPVHAPDHGGPGRPVSDVRAMALAVQANLVQFKVALTKRSGADAAGHDIRVPPPGAVKRYRESLVAPKVLAGYSPAELALRLHEFWGRFCLMCWLFSVTPPETANLATIAVDAAMHCGTGLNIKEAEVHAMLWRIQFESRVRHDRQFRAGERFECEAPWAARIPVRAFGKAIEECTEDELLLAGCQHAGMLATLRWAMDRTRDWSDPGLMHVRETPF
jgi:hypothetical protein